jgi:HD-GYP domain-containing protein (c-di-GMP phosphodiesterase class II)
MPTSKQSHYPAVSGTFDKLREHPGKGAESDSTVLPWTQPQHEALLRVIPDQVFRVKLQHDGSVSVTVDGASLDIPPEAVAGLSRQFGAEAQPDDMVGRLRVELARQARALMDGCLRTEEVHVLHLQIEHKGQTACHEVRVAACGNGEILALVRDITERETSDNSMAGSGHSAPSLDSMVRSQVSQYAEDEEVIRDVSGKLNNLLEDTIKAIQSVVQKKDPSTARHQTRVWKLACAISREMGLGKTRVAIIGLAALVHDFGKVFIPADILNKPGKLTEAEFSAVKNHAEAVFQVLSTIDLFCPIADIVHQHHERINGSGYPLGLKGDDILLEARIIAVADVVEAMLSDRPHRRALGVEAAMKEIAGGRGILYDADAVDACIKLFTVGKFEFDAD